MKRWTPAQIARIAKVKEKKGIKAACEHFKISSARVYQLIAQSRGHVAPSRRARRKSNLPAVMPATGTQGPIDIQVLDSVPAQSTRKAVVMVMAVEDLKQMMGGGLW